MPVTTAGSILIKNMMPTKQARDAYNLYRPLDKGGMKDLVNMIIEKGGEHGYETINDLTKTFFNKATEIGSTTPLSDYINDSDERETTFSEFEKKVADILAKHLPKMEQAKELDDLARVYSGKVSNQNLEYLVSRGSVAAKMAQSGARGNKNQLQQATASPLMAQDVKGLPIPIAIKHSYAEGLSNAEFLATSYGGRASTVMSQLSTEKPGALFKRLTPAVFHEIVTMSDCGTKNGIYIPIQDKLSIIGRFQAVTNKLIDQPYYKELVTSGMKKVLARNVMTCRAKEGICQKCYGLAANGQLPHIGQNMGIIAAQSVSEVLTQAMLSTKHQGGVAGRQRNPYEEANNLLSNPDNFQDEATIASNNGSVRSMKQNSLKDWSVDIGGHDHFIPNYQTPLVKVGDEVRVGDPISTGTLNPRKLTELKGAGAGRMYLANKMREIYSRNAHLDARHFDLIARNMIKHNEVVDPGDSGFMPGDKVEVGQIEHSLEENSHLVPLAKAKDKTLATGIMDLTPGTLLTQNHLDDLAANGVKNVNVSNVGLVVKPMVPGLQSLKLLDKNWVSNLSFNRLHKTIQEAAALGQRSPIHGTEPITAYVMGSEFGEGQNGKY